MLTLTPPPDATGFSSGTDFILLIMLLAEALPEDQCDSVSDGRDPPGATDAPMAPKEFRGLDRISLLTGEIRSGKEATELRLLLAADVGVGMSVVSGPGVKCVSINDRRYRFALSLGPASFSVK